MPAFFHIGQDIGAINYAATVTYYATITMGNVINLSVTTENFIKTPIRTAGVYSQFTRRCSSNSITATSTETFRIGGVNGNQSVTLPASTSGNVTDGVNTDTISSGNLISSQFVIGATGTTLTSSGTSAVFTPTSGNYITYSSGQTSNHTTNSATAFNAINGSLLANNAVEANAQTMFRCTGTLNNIFVNVSANTRITTTTVNSRIGGANGNQTIPVTTTTTGILEDNVNTDVIVSGTLIGIGVVKSTGGGNFTSQTGMSFVPDNSFPAAWQNAAVSGNATLAATTSVLGPFAGGNSISGGDTNQTTRATPGVALVATDLFVYINANPGSSSNSTSFLRKNGSNGNLTTVTAFGVTGLTEDTINVDVINSTTAVNTSINNQTNGTIGYNSVGACYQFANISIFPIEWMQMHPVSPHKMFGVVAY